LSRHNISLTTDKTLYTGYYRVFKESGNPKTLTSNVAWELVVPRSSPPVELVFIDTHYAHQGFMFVSLASLLLKANILFSCSKLKRHQMCHHLTVTFSDCPPFSSILSQYNFRPAAKLVEDTNLCWKFNESTAASVLIMWRLPLATSVTCLINVVASWALLSLIVDCQNINVHTLSEQF